MRQLLAVVALSDATTTTTAIVVMVADGVIAVIGVNSHNDVKNNNIFVVTGIMTTPTFTPP